MSNSCKIINIEANAEQTRIEFSYTNQYSGGGWLRIEPDCFIRPVGTELILKLTKAEGIPYAPEKLHFPASGDIIYYNLFFPPLPPEVTEIDIIEKEDDKTFLNFYRVPLKNSNLLMETSKMTILKKIEQIAIELKAESRKTKSYPEEIARLDAPLSEMADFLKLSKEETAIFSLAMYISVTRDSFCISEIKSYTEFSPFDFFEIKNIVKGLLKKGWIVKSGSVGMHRGARRMEEKVFNIPQEVLDALSKNSTPEIKKKELDVYMAAEMLFKCFKEHYDDTIETDEMETAIADYEEEYPEISFFKISSELNLVHKERLLFYFVIAKTSNGEEIIDVDRMLSTIFQGNSERIAVKKMLTARHSILFKDKFIEFVNEDFRTDRQLKLTADGVKRVFGEDACFLLSEEEFSSGICKLIKHESITEKELFYNENERESVSTVAEFLKMEKYAEIVKRLEENKMRPGLTILLHGYPGTGKTETIYQLARQTKRNILMVNISEIRDKWVGESEKRLKTVFETYKNSFKHFDQAPILLFNESDALIGKRITVNTSVDQMNNAMQNILLQELEDFHGILLATTNLTSNLDEAFERRFLFKIKFARPSFEAKKFIWKSKLNFLAEEDAKRLAEEFEFSGGQIENISRKIFLDSVLLGKTNSMEDIRQYCIGEMLLKENNRKKIGFTSKK